MEPRLSCCPACSAPKSLSALLHSGTAATLRRCSLAKALKALNLHDALTKLAWWSCLVLWIGAWSLRRVAEGPQREDGHQPETEGEIFIKAGGFACDYIRNCSAIDECQHCLIQGATHGLCMHRTVGGMRAHIACGLIYYCNLNI